MIVHLVASVHSGHTSAIQVLVRFGAAARGHPLYEALVQYDRYCRRRPRQPNPKDVYPLR